MAVHKSCRASINDIINYFLHTVLAVIIKDLSHIATNSTSHSKVMHIQNMSINEMMGFFNSRIE